MADGGKEPANLAVNVKVNPFYLQAARFGNIHITEYPFEHFLKKLHKNKLHIEYT